MDTGVSMGWTALVATALGAVIGVGSSVLTEWMRTTRERAQRKEAQRDQLYADYLAAIARAADDLWTLGNDEDRGNLLHRAHDFWRVGNVYPLRYQVTIKAPTHIVEASDACFRQLRHFRDVVGGGAPGGSREFTQAQERYGKALVRLHAAMRYDLKTDKGAARALPAPGVSGVRVDR